LLCAQDARCSWFPLHCGGSGRDARRGGAMDRADSAVCTRMCTQRNTGELTRTFRAGARKAQCQGCASLWLLSLAQARESNSLGRRPSESSALHKERKVTRSAAGRVKALLLSPSIRPWSTAHATGII